MEYLLILVWWVATAGVEGIKFGKFSTLLKLDYHAWRLLQVAPILPLGVLHIGWFGAVGVWLVGWFVYERILARLWRGGWWGKKPPYEIMGWEIDRAVWFDILMLVIGLGLTALWLLGG